MLHRKGPEWERMMWCHFRMTQDCNGKTKDCIEFPKNLTTLWITRQFSTTQLLPHPPQWDGGGNNKGKIEKIYMSWDKGHLLGKAKATSASRAKQGLEFTASHWQADFRHSQESQAHHVLTVPWEGKCHHSKCSLFHLPSSFCYMMPYGIEYLFGQSGSAFLVLALAPPSPTRLLVHHQLLIIRTSTRSWTFLGSV